MQKILYFFLFLLVCSGSSYPEAFENVFRKAGGNCKELENLCENKTQQGETPEVQPHGATLPP